MRAHRRPLRVGVVGAGVMGTRRAAAAHASGDRIVAVVDLDPNLARRLGRQYTALVAGSIHDLPAVGCEVVVVATNHASLATAAGTLLAGGCHVLVEKPGAMRSVDLAGVLRLARKHGQYVGVGYSLRHYAAVRALRVVSREIGDLRHMRAVYGHGGRVGMDKEWRCDPSLGGGELLDQGVHLLDLAQFVLGPINTVAGYLTHAFWSDAVEDNAFVLAQAARGTAILHASWTEWRNTFRVEVFGTRGSVHLDGLAGNYGQPRLLTRRVTTRGQRPVEQIRNVVECDPFVAEWIEFVRACSADQPSLDGLERAVETLRLVDSLRGVDPREQE